MRIAVVSLLIWAMGCHHGSTIYLPPRPDLPSSKSMLGWYDIGSERQVFVTEGPTGGLRLFDFDSAQFAALRPQPDSSWTWSVDGKPERRLRIERDPMGSVASLTWTDTSGGSGRLPRAFVISIRPEGR